MVSIDWLPTELTYWAHTFNKKFVLMVEGLLNDCFTLHQRFVNISCVVIFYYKRLKYFCLMPEGTVCPALQKLAEVFGIEN